MLDTRHVVATEQARQLQEHPPLEVERLADRVTIIREGATVESGTIAELRHLTRSQVSIVVDGPVEALAALPGVHDLAHQDGHVTFAVDDDRLP